MTNSKASTRWIRQLLPLEEYHEVTQRNNTFMTLYNLSLAAAQPLKYDDFLTALHHLRRKVILFRLAIRKRADEKLWFCEVDNKHIDFEIIENANIGKVGKSMTFDSYDSHDDSLWRAKLQYQPTQPCCLPELENQYPHQYTFLMTSHHGITDGTSSHTILKLFFEILNKVISRQPVDDEQFGFLTDNSETQDLIKKRKEVLIKDPDLLKQIQQEVEKSNTMENYLSRLTDNHFSTNIKSLNETRVIEPEINKKLYKKFKELGVSFHAGFFSLVNVALVEMIKNKSIIQSHYEIGAVHVVNNRKFWTSPDKKLAFGNVYGSLKFSMIVPNQVNESNTINQMKDYHTKLHQYINNNRVFDEIICAQLKNDSKQTAQDLMNNPPISHVYYAASNMTDVTSLIGTGGEQVQLTSVARTTTINKLPFPLLFMIHSFRGQFIIGLDYSTERIPTSFAKELSNKAVSLCKKFAQ